MSDSINNSVCGVTLWFCCLNNNFFFQKVLSLNTFCFIEHTNKYVNIHRIRTKAELIVLFHVIVLV